MVSYWVQNRRDTASNWTSYNPTLRPGEIGHETDTNRSKMGDGVTAWRSLSYWNPSGGVTAVNGQTGNVSLPQLGIPRVMGFGHSYMAGYGSIDGSQSYLSRLASALGAEEVNYAVSGAVLAQDNSSGHAGGYAAVTNSLTPRIFYNENFQPRNFGPYLPVSPVVVFNYGYNDLFFLGSTIQQVSSWFGMALTASVCVSRAGGWFTDTDASVAYSSGWTANTGVAVYGYQTNHQTSTTGHTVTITVPADFPGGEIDLLTLTFGGGTKWSTVVDGGSPQILDGTGSLYGSFSGQANLVVQRLTGLSKGTHTIVLTVVSIDASASAFFQGYLVAAPTPPVTVIVNAPQNPALPVTGGNISPVTWTTVQALNATMASVAASFSDGLVVIADIASAFAAVPNGATFAGQPGSLYNSDGVHPNAAGHALIASVILNAIGSSPYTAETLVTPMATYQRLIGQGVEPVLAANWSPHSSSNPWFGKDRAGNVVFRARLVRSGSPTLGETVLQFPTTYLPSDDQVFLAWSWNAGGTVASLGTVQVTHTGALLWIAGDPSHEFDVYGTWQADGVDF
jgi:lysophospholipase L1-like esterase